MYKLRLFFISLVVITACTLGMAAAPQWWQERGVTPEGTDESSVKVLKDNYSVVTQGQLMNMAKHAAEELNAKASGGAGSEITSLVESFYAYSVNNPAVDNASLLANGEAVNIGQLKKVAKPFYDRLWEIESSFPESVIWPSGISFLSGGIDAANHKYPWAVSTPVNMAENLEAANIGQVKFLFSWSLVPAISILPDSDGDGIPDALEDMYGNEWNQNVEAARFLSIIPVGGNIRTGENGVPLAEPLKVKVVNEKGTAVSGVPLSFSAAAGTLAASSAVTDANGVASTGFTPDFSEGDKRNVVLISASSDRQKCTAHITVSSAALPLLISPNSSYKSEWETDADSSKIESDKPTVDSFADILYCDDYKFELEIETRDYRDDTLWSLWTDTISSTPISSCTTSSGTGESRQQIVRIKEFDIGTIRQSYINKSNVTERFFYYRVDSLNNTCYPHAGDSHGESTNNVVRVSEAEWRNPPAIPIQYKDWLVEHSQEKDHGNYAISTQRSEYFYSYPAWIYGYPLKNFNGIGASIMGVLGSGASIDIGELYLNYEGYDDRFIVEFSIEQLTQNKIYFSINGGDWSLSQSVKFVDNPRSVRFRREQPGAVASAIFTVKTSCVGKEVCSDTFKVELSDLSSSQDYTMPANESAGPRYRKISLSGRPLSDDKPQSEEEDDMEPAETFVDALSLSLCHDAVDILIPVPGSEMQLALRRRYSPLAWSNVSGLRPHESPENAFGGAWVTGAVSYVKLESQNASILTSPDMATVVDENGSVFSFAYARRKFYPMPNGVDDQQAFLSSLTRDASSGELIFTKRFGTKLTYEGVPVIKLRTLANRAGTGDEGIEYEYYRLKSVEDRYGNVIEYKYSDSAKTMIPDEIAVKGRPDMAIRIEQNDGRISKAWDPEGNCIEYSYGNSSTTDEIPMPLRANCHVLTSVSRGGSAILSYQYGDIDAEEDAYFLLLEERDKYNYSLYLRSVTDATGRTYSFEYDGNLGLHSYSTKAGGYYIPNNRPKPLSKVTLPDGSYSEFFPEASVKLVGSAGKGWAARADTFSVANGSYRTTRVKDADGNQVLYTWLDTREGSAAGSVDVRHVKDFAELYNIPIENPFSNPLCAYYPHMRIEHFDGFGEGASLIGSETFEFEPEAGMALKKTTDFSGNITEYEYNDALPESRAALAYAAKFSDPNKEMRTVGGVEQSKLFTYSENFRIMDSMTDELGRITKWEVDSLGRRTSEKVYASAANAAAETGVLKETSFTYDTTFKGFLTDTTIKNGAGSGKDMTTRNVPDTNGRVASTIVDPDGLEITTSYQYNKNGRKILETDPNGNQTAFEYDAFSRLVKRTNPDGTTNLTAYDGAGRKVSSTNENGVETVYAYNPNGLLSTTTILMEQGDGNDITTSTEYSHAGKILKTTDGNGNETVFEYDGMGRLLKMAKCEGASPSGAVPDASSEGIYVTKYAYEGNCGSGVFSTDLFKPSAVTDPRGNTSYFTHDELYREKTVTLPFGDTGSTTSYSYDAVGNKISETDALGNTTQYEYNALNQQIKTVFADDTDKAATYSPVGLALTETDELGNTVSHEYDKAGRKIKTTFPQVLNGLSGAMENPVEEYCYDKNGNLTSKKDAVGNVWNSVYDSRNRLVAEIAPAVRIAGNYRRPTKTSVYDGVGNVIQSIDAKGYATDTEYDNANRAVKVTFPEVRVGGSYSDSSVVMARPEELRSYDKNGNAVSATNPRGIVTETSYNCLNKPIQVVKNAGASNDNQKITEQMSYDGNGNLLEITDGNGNKTRYEYDAMNRRTKATYGYDSPTTRTDEWQYDELNNTKFRTKNMMYDSRNRLRAEGGYEPYYDKIVWTRYRTYDPCGRLLYVGGEENGAPIYSYDAIGRVTKDGGTFEYDLGGRRTKASFGSHLLYYSYDTNGRITKITDQKERAMLFSYDLNGNMTQKTYPNGSVVYDTRDALNRLTVRIGPSSQYYYYDIGGNIIAFYQGGANTLDVPTIVYDAFDRIKNETIYDGTSLWERSYSYDKNSNRTYLLETSRGSGNSNPYDKTVNYTLNSMNQLVSAVTTVQPLSPETLAELDEPIIDIASFTYDDRGRMRKLVNGKRETTMSYNFDDMATRLTVTRPGVSSLLMVNSFDYRGRLLNSTETIRYPSGISRTSKFKTYSYSEGVQVGHTEMIGGETTAYYYYRGPDQGGGVGGLNYAENSDGSNLNYKFMNLRGDVIATQNEAKVRTFESNYYAFGEHKDFYSDIKTDTFRANTKQELSDDLLNEGRRIRSLEYGVFLTPDPLEYVDGFNPYIYCNQNPWGRWDPIGLKMVIKPTMKRKGEVNKAATKRFRKEAMEGLQKLTNDKLKMNETTGNVEIAEKGTANKGKNLASGTKLIAELINNKKHTVSIEYNTEYSNITTGPIGQDENASNGVGRDSNVFLGPRNTRTTKVKNKDGKITLNDRPDFIGVAHELIHALNNMLGKSLTGRTKREYFVDISSDYNKDTFIFWSRYLGRSPANMRFDQATGYVCENILNDELQTVGIGGFNGSSITENDIRKEHGIQERAEY